MTPLLRHIALMLIRFYRGCVSPFLPVACRFHPTCSEYAAQAISAHGVLRGGLLAFHRLLRCNPWGGQGVDEVPPCPRHHSPLSVTKPETL